MQTNVAGIPCLIQVDHYFRQPPLGIYCDSDVDAIGYVEIDYTVCDRRGRPAPWLKRKVTRAEDMRLRAEIEEAMRYE